MSLKHGIAILTAIAVAALFWSHGPMAVQAQSGNFCDRNQSVSIAAAATVTIAAVPGTTIRVCAYSLTADTIATTGAFTSGSTSITGAMRFCDECNNTAGDGTGILFQAPGDGALTLTAATGAITGWIRYGQN